MIGRLPPLALGKDCCRLPLSEPTASALLSALLESQSHERCAILAEALAPDPALALWGGRHFAAPSPAQAVPAIFTLASWLEEKLPLLLAPAKRADNDRHDPTTLPVDRIYFAKLAAADVAAAEATTGDILNDPLYLVTLLRSAPDWLTAGGCAGEGAGIAAGWLGECSRMLLHPAGESRADGSVATADDPFAAPAPHSLLPGTGRSSAARQRWLEPPGFASQHFTLVAARLARLDDFELPLRCKTGRRKNGGPR